MIVENIGMIHLLGFFCSLYNCGFYLFIHVEGTFFKNTYNLFDIRLLPEFKYRTKIELCIAAKLLIKSQKEKFLHRSILFFSIIDLIKL